MPVDDVEWMERTQLKTEIRKLRAINTELTEAIKTVVTQRGDDFCWRDAYTHLAKLVGINFCPELMDDKEKMLENCKCFIDSLYSGGPYIPVYVEKRPKE